MPDLAYTVDSGIENIKVRELTMADLRRWMKSREQWEKDEGAFDLIKDTLFDEFRLDDLVFMTDATADTLDSMTPAKVHALFQKCKEVNTDFFSWRARMRALPTAQSKPASS